MVAVNYDWDELEDNIDEEYDDAGVTVAEYTTEPEQFGNVISQRRDGQSSFLHCDGLGSTVALTNAVGNVTDTIRYSAFGERTERTGTTEIPFQYVGQKEYYQDGAPAGYYVRARPLDVENGRWRSADPSPVDEYSNPYSYLTSNPTLLTDPSGLQPAPPKKTCKCHGCLWSFTGASGNLGLYGGYTYARVTARCAQAERRAHRIYTCRNGITIRKAIHCYCEAKLSFHIPSLGIQFGGDWIGIVGSFRACTDQDISNSWGWNWGLTFLVVGGEGGGDFSGDPVGNYIGGGFAPGLGFAICVNYTVINMRDAGLVCKREALNLHERKLERDNGPCTHHDERERLPVPIVDNPDAVPAPGVDRETE